MPKSKLKIVKGNKRRRRAKSNPGPSGNPAMGQDLVEYIVPGFAAFAATRFMTRIAATQIAKRYPRYAKHAGALASAGAFAGAYFGAHRVKQLEPYHHPIVVGAAIAAVQSVIQIYLPMLGWMVADASPELGTSSAASPAALAPAPPMQALPVPDGFRETTANEWFSYNDSFDAGAYKGKKRAPVPPTQAAVPSEPDDASVDDLLDDDTAGDAGHNADGLFS